jgi:hypothetical protein
MKIKLLLLVVGCLSVLFIAQGCATVKCNGKRGMRVPMGVL